ncbi:hypothetical protein L1987_43079 [Smallanthus sonchifolius]|uniref:Uncharacterized protein n=1 Tax=Smallanthus sonchifolius TaxID=185202 RepID=A0ACB9GLD8_9ASTR|nr:hypothetical protein L1987_43079 [Smallanthus sonchifolius]
MLSLTNFVHDTGDSSLSPNSPNAPHLQPATTVPNANQVPSCALCDEAQPPLTNQPTNEPETDQTQPSNITGPVLSSAHVPRAQVPVPLASTVEESDPASVNIPPSAGHPKTTRSKADIVLVYVLIDLGSYDRYFLTCKQIITKPSG